jgi:uncharacterized membrane protein HdeD (DUF308 family)
MTDSFLLVIAAMFVVSGVVAVLVGRRAVRLGIPVWLGRVIAVVGVLLMLAGVAGAVLAFQSSRY